MLPFFSLLASYAPCASVLASRRFYHHGGPIAARAKAAAMSTAKPRKQLAALTPSLYAELNAAAFGGVLPDSLALRWNPRLRRTAGRCHFFAPAAGLAGQRSAEIELSPRVVDSVERLRETLAHEMCHAAQWVVDGEARPPHGEAFQRWARLAEQNVPGLAITTRHDYAIFCRFRYECAACGARFGRHSRLDTKTRVCGRCRGEIKLAGVFERRDGGMIVQQQQTAVGSTACEAAHATSTATTTARARPAPAFAAFVKAEYAEQRARWPKVSHGRIMQTLARKWHRRPRGEK